MRVTIIADDNMVYVDGEALIVDCSPLAAEGKHCVQWYDTAGEVEFRTEIDAERGALTRKPNEKITDFSPYQAYVDQWQIEKAKQDDNAEQQLRLAEEQSRLAEEAVASGHALTIIDLDFFNLENRVRALEGQQPLTLDEFRAKLSQKK